MRIDARRKRRRWNAPWPIIALALLGGCAGEGKEAARQIEVADNPAALRHIGDAALASGDAAQARAFYQRAAALHPDSIETQIDYAHALAAEGKIEDAIGVLDAARAGGSVSPQLFLTLGRRPLSALSRRVSAGPLAMRIC
jgi:predicted Zn-dependent protease